MNTTSEMEPATEPATLTDDWRVLARRFLICNPFYLVSAALLLLGVNRLSIDPGFLGDERQNLLFNFLALQVYGLLVAGTAIVLRRRRVWYDSALLVVLEHGLVLVPFMLVSQAALISERLGWVLTMTGGGLVIGRAMAIRRGYPEFNLPPGALGLGLVVLVANVALPFGFQAVVARSAISDWEAPNRWIWLAGLPALVLGALLLPRARSTGPLEPQRRWLPLLIHALWVGGTGVHVWCIAYVSKFSLVPVWLAPAVTAASWVLYARSADLTERGTVLLRRVALVGAVSSPLLAWDDGRVLVAALVPSLLAVGVVAIAGDVVLRRAARWMLLAGVLVLAVGSPEAWWEQSNLDRGQAMGIALGCLLVAGAFRTAHPFVGLAAGLVLGGGVNWVTGGAGVALVIQVGLAFALVHSIFWDPEAHSGAGLLRTVVAVIWAGGAVDWTHAGGLGAMGWTAGLGLLVMAGWVVSNWLRGEWGLWLMGVCAAVTTVAGPAQWVIAHATAGILALFGSFLCFGIGTAVAWRRGTSARDDGWSPES